MITPISLKGFGHVDNGLPRFPKLVKLGDAALGDN